MYGCDNHIGCLSVSVNRIGGGLSVNSTRIGDDLPASAYRLGEKLRVTCSLVCTVEKNLYLDVVPDYVWLSPDMLSGEFDIISNTRWEIV